MNFLASYKRRNEKFIETCLAKACQEKLEKFGFAVLTGKQGSGKTSIAIHIMTDPKYEEWKKLKLTSWEDLLVFEFTEKTLIYIDNLFDGFVYYLDVDKWWYSLIFFYFKRVKQIDNIRLMITVKKVELERACAFINSDEQTMIRACLVKEDSFPLSHNEKISILNSQIALANKKKSTKTPFISRKLKLNLTDIPCPVGFPLCAHMYAFEKDQTFRDISIFQSPRSYVRNQIFQKTESDKTGGVKTLFLFIIFHTCLESSENLDLKFENECKTFFGKICPADVIKKLEPLSYTNLYERAQELKETVLIEYNRMFEFKHQIYLEGAIDYMFRKYFDPVVDHFPLSILRAYEMQDNSEEQIPKLIKRMKKEIAEGKISEALSCKVFQEIEQDFCENIQKETQLMTELLSATDNSSGFKFPLIFWANKFYLPRLSKTLLGFAEKFHKDEQLLFYLALFGECCAYDEDFIKRAKQPPIMKELQSLVREFKTSEGGMTVSHLILSSKRSDNDAFQCLRRISLILKESEESSFKCDKSLLDCLLKQTKYSRLQCLLEVLKNLPKNVTKDSIYITILIKELKLASAASNHLLELELLCRISILVAYGANGFTPRCRHDFFIYENYDPKITPREKTRLQNCMAHRIRHCISCLPWRDEEFSEVLESISLKLEMEPTLMTTIKICIAILTKREETLFA